jgi:hypothetical protein
MLVARAVLACEPRERGRGAALTGLGFVAPERRRDQGYEALFEGIAWIFLSVFVYFYLAGTSSAPAVLSSSSLVVVITITQGAALAAAIVPKMHYAFASGGLREREPVLFELLAGCVAVAIMLAVNVVAALLTGHPGAVSHRLQEVVPFVVAPFVTAATTAWLVQDHRWHNVVGEARRRTRDAAVMAGAWLCMSLLSRFIAGELGLPVRGGPLFALMFSVCMGGLLGYLVPFRVRFAPRVPARSATTRRDGATTVHATTA